MSNFPIIETINTNIANLKDTKQEIKSSVNVDYDIIANQQIEAYPELIKQGIALYKDRIPHVNVEGKQITVPNAVPLKFENIIIKGNAERKILPEGYKALEYIESTGTQYIDTGLIGTDLIDSEIELIIKNNTTGLNQYNFNGVYQTGKITQMGTVATSNTTCRCTINFGFTEGAGVDSLDITKFHKLYAKNGLQKVNDTQVGTKSFGSLNEYPFLLFARTNIIEAIPTIEFNKGSSIKSFWVKKNGKYIRNLVPALKKASKNLANLHDINRTALSLNFKTGNNMTIVVNGTKASGANVISIANPNIMLPAGTYTVKIKMIDGTISNITGGAIFGINASTYAMRTTPQVNKVGDIGKRTFTLTEDTLLTSLDITPSYGDVGSVWDNATFECWLYSGSDDVPYEPYSPEQVGMYDFNATSENLLNRATCQENMLLTWASGTPYAEAGSLVTDFMEVKIGDKFVSNYRYQKMFYDKDKNYLGALCTDGTLKINRADIANTTTEFTVPNISDIVYVRLGYRKSLNSNTDMTTANIMLNEGTEVLPYEPYQKRFYANEGTEEFVAGETRHINVVTGENTITINNTDYPLNLGNIELCKIENYQDKIIKVDNTWKIRNKIIKIDSYNGETITTPYISTTGGLDTGATVYYVGTEDYIITDDVLISQLNAIDKVKANSGTTVIKTSGQDLEPILSATVYKEVE